MNRQRKLIFDEVGNWSEVKLDIIREYAKAYSSVLSAQRNPRLHHVYIEGFAGAGIHDRKSTGEAIKGSPLIAIETDPRFCEYYFIDLDGEKVDFLKDVLIGESGDTHFFHGDCNEVLLKKVFPKVRFEDYRRGLCVLDPYGLHLNWEVVQVAGQMRSMEIFLNFPVMDMNRNVFWRDSEKVASENVARMTAFWGDESWRAAKYRAVPSLFDDLEERTDNDTVAEAFRQRLLNVAGFKYVPEPIPMRNSIGKTIYYLFFASQKPVARDIVTHIFNKYGHCGERCVQVAN